jgi:hypothetical protein
MIRTTTIVAAALAATAGTALAVPLPPNSLNKCQSTVMAEGKKFIQSYVADVAACLQKVSTDMVQKNLVAPSSSAAKACVSLYRQISDSRALGKSLAEKLAAKITLKCAPGGNNTHTLQDILGTGAGVLQPLDAENLGAYCAKFGGDGTIDTLQEWITCVTAAHTCAARAALALQYPRALDWLPLVQPVMSAMIPPSTDLMKITDAVAGLAADDTAIEGPTNDGKPEIICGGAPASGNAVGGDVLAGKTFSNSSAIGLSGTMANNGAATITPGTANLPIAAGYHNGAGYCAGDADLVSSNVRFGANLFGVSGTVIQASGLAGLADVLAGKTFSNFGGAGSGTMPNNGAVTITPNTAPQTIALGYHNGSGSVAGDADLVASNIVSGVDIFGVTGTAPTTCGNGTIEAPEQCDTAAFGGATCVSLGFAAGGTLSCTVGCAYNTSTCLAQAFPETGQTTCYDAGGLVIACAGSGQDGETLGGSPLSYTDNGDGTITDNNTKLMWEKLSDDGSIHDKDDNYDWTTAVTTKIAALSSGSFAGHTDWRLPNVRELQSIINYQNSFPSVSTAFNTGCVASCTVTSCSCTQSFFWSATTYQNIPNWGWIVYFGDGYILADIKTNGYHVRAVRGGS